MRQVALLSGALLTAFNLQVPVLAQDADDTISEIEVITVSIQKREQLLSDVPASITVVDTDDIQLAGGNDLRSSIERTPGAAFVGLGFSGNNSISLRGLGGLATFGPFDSSVSYTIDENAIPLRSFDSILLDAKQVEILKGPQGTLYGRSTIGGAVNIVTNELTDEWMGEGST